MWHHIFRLIPSLGNRLREYRRTAQDITIRPDDIFIVSYPRSGNTWVRFLLANLIRYDNGEAVDFHSVHQVVPAIEVPAHRERLRTMSSPRLIKSHNLYDPRFSRVIYLLRDGRDVMVSYYCYQTGQGYFKGSFLEFLKKRDLRPCLWHEHVESWLQDRDRCALLLIRYEDLLCQPEAELEKMSRFAGLPCEGERLRWAVSSSTFEAMRKTEREKGRAFRPTQEFDFVRKGIVGDWQNHFDSAHKRVFKSYANQTLLRFGYVDGEDW